MLKLNVNQEKQLTFEVQIGGVQSDQVSSHLRIEIDGIEYGFPAVVGRESITVNLPPLRTVTARKIKEGEEVQVKLEIVADGNYLTPWQDTFRLSNPLVIEAKIIDDEFNPAPAFRTKLVTEGKIGDQKQGVKLERVDESEETSSLKSLKDNNDELTDKLVEKLSEKFASLINAKDKKEDVEPVQESCGRQHIKEEDDEEENSDQLPPKEDQEKVKESPNTAMEKILAQTLTKLGLFSEDNKPVKKNKKVTLEQFKKNLTKEDILKYMSRAGTKNPQIQEIVYEQAVSVAKSDAPVEVLKQVINLMKKNKKS